MTGNITIGTRMYAAHMPIIGIIVRNSPTLVRIIATYSRIMVADVRTCELLLRNMEPVVRTVANSMRNIYPGSGRK